MYLIMSGIDSYLLNVSVVPVWLIMILLEYYEMIFINSLKVFFYLFWGFLVLN